MQLGQVSHVVKIFFLPARLIFEGNEGTSVVKISGPNASLNNAKEAAKRTNGVDTSNRTELANDV